MRLKQIKLNGFKSFVDPTTVPFPSNLTAIVGPNGCGKSNVIDAVRWVMGESSAKNLRGENSTDVIFNGSSARKPVGQASIELVFDNSDGSLGGEYAAYAEIAIKRLITRDGTSTYFLNGTRCRRKDITDIFLGTGLGPRSYAIIEQGMVSRLIESKPQELRIFVEEAAGISKYKERRKETESRIGQTRENLARLSDIRDELGRQLSHLQRQAHNAAKFKEFRQEERDLKARLAALRYRELNTRIENLDRSIGSLDVDSEARMAEVRALDASTEESRNKHIELTDNFNAVQGKFHGANAEIVRLEQAIKYTRERRHTLRDDLIRLEQSQKAANEHLQLDTEKLSKVSVEIEQLEPELNRLETVSNSGQGNLNEHEAALAAWQIEWDDFNSRAAQTSQQAQVERTRASHSEMVLSRITQRIQRITQEVAALDAQPGNEELLQLEERLLDAEDTAEKVREQHANGMEKINSLRDRRRDLGSKIDLARNELHGLKGKKVALEALQKAALARGDEKIGTWLSQHGLAQRARVSSNLKVESGWELALETVLSEQLQAIVVDKLDDVLSAVQQLRDGCVQFVEASSSSSISTRRSLAQFVVNGVVPTSLHSVFVVDSLETALRERAQLQPHESFVTRDGLVVGRNYLKAGQSSEASIGVIERGQQLESLTKQVEEREAQLLELEEHAEQVREDLRLLEASWGELQKQLTESEKLVVECRGLLAQKQTKLDQMKRQRDQLLNESRDLDTQKIEEDERLAECRMKLQEAVEQMGNDHDRRDELQAKREELRQILDHARDSARDAKEVYHKLALRMESLRAEFTSTKTSEQRVREQLAVITERRDQLEMQIEESIEPLAQMESDLESALNRKIAIEVDLTQARDALAGVDQEVRAYERRRHELEQSAQAVGSRVNNLRIERSEVAVRREQQVELLQQEERDLDATLALLTDADNEGEMGSRLSEIGERIQRLGAINLAAIDEFNEQSQRKIYLDSQNDDLNKALETLEDAIKKIDQETRSKFKDTFDLLNKYFQELFPKIFGGGHAYLELTGEDLLETGVAVMARPPGKRNSTIHLLSGGEKALTAIALVFSIFKLNPAPFCILDEVDAPLDDANTERYAKLVKEMSETIQFIYISHNKIAMEMANQLCGVTMQEPGVSRIVAVDIEQAAALAGV